mgnify:FL=1
MTRHLRRRTTQGLLAVLAGLWLLAAAAPCVMAAPHCPHGMSDDCDSMNLHQQAAIDDCETLQAVDCQNGQTDVLAANIPFADFSVLPVLLFTLPHDALSNTERAQRVAPDRYAFDLYPPPLRLQYSVFLI